MLLHHLQVELNESVKDYLFVGQFWNIFDEVEQEIFKIWAVDDEQPEELIWLFEGCDGESLKLLSVDIQLFENVPFFWGEDVVSFFPAHDLTDWMGADQ